MERKLRKNTS